MAEAVKRPKDMINNKNLGTWMSWGGYCKNLSQ